VVRAKIAGAANPEDTKAEQHAALSILIEYIRARAGSAGGSVGPTASRRMNEYHAELVSERSKGITAVRDGSGRLKPSAYVEPAAARALREKMETYVARGPSYRVQVLSALLSKESVEAYKQTNRYLEDTAPERRLAELRDKGNNVRSELQTLEAQSKITAARLEAYVSGGAEMGDHLDPFAPQKAAVQYASDLSRATRLVHEIDQRLSWSRGKEGEEFFALTSSPERKAWDATRGAAVVQARRLIAHLQRDLGSSGPSAGGGGGDTSDPNSRRAQCRSSCEVSHSPISKCSGMSDVSSCMSAENASRDHCLAMCP
jgi:hypothetical protein